MVGTRGRPVCDAMALARRRDPRVGRGCPVDPACGHRGRQVGNRLMGIGARPVRPRRTRRDCTRRVRGCEAQPLPGATASAAGLGWIPATYVGWALTMLFAKAALHVQASPRRLLTTLVFFRGIGAPLPGLGAGPLLLTLVLTVVLMPLLVAFEPPRFRSRPMADSRLPCRRRVRLPVGLHRYRAYRSVRSAQLVAEPSRSGRCRSGGRACRRVGRRHERAPSSAARRARRCGGRVRRRSICPRTPEVAVDQLCRRRPSVRTRRLGRGRGRALRRKPASADVHPPQCASTVESPGGDRSRCAVGGRAGLHAGCPSVPRAGVRVRRRRLPSRQCRRPVHLVAADRRRLRCGDRRHRWRHRPRAPRRMASAREIPIGVAGHRGHGVLRSGHHAADSAARAHRQRRSALLPHHRERARPRARLHRTTAMARLRELPPECIPRPALPGRAVDQLSLRRHELLRSQDDVDRDRHAGRVGRRLARQATRWSRSWPGCGRIRRRVSQPLADRQLAVPRGTDGVCWSR